MITHSHTSGNQILLDISPSMEIESLSKICQVIRMILTLSFTFIILGLQYLYNRDTQNAGVFLDLDKNLEKVIKPLPIKDEEKLNNLLNGVLAYKSRFAVNGELKTLHTDVVCFRGLLTTIMCTPYERRDDWMLEVVRWKGTLYLMQVQTNHHKHYTVIISCQG